jgi:hypothetical protein
MKKYYKHLILLIIFILLITGCAKNNDSAHLFKAAMNDAVFSEDSEVKQLVTLTNDNPNVIWDDLGEHVLLLTWHDYDDNCLPGSSINQKFGDIWATSVGEMVSWYRDNKKNVSDWDLRFAQLLGVHDNEGYTRFSAFWVSPDDVIRPAYITDVTEQMKNDYSNVTDEAYKEWFNNNIIWSYFESDYPWTRLGYTYDWGGEDEYGLTEFVIFDGSKVEIEFTYTTAEFVNWLDEQLQ